MREIVTPSPQFVELLLDTGVVNKETLMRDTWSAFVREYHATLATVSAFTGLDVVELFRMLDINDPLWRTMDEVELLTLWAFCRSNRHGKYLLFYDDKPTYEYVSGGFDAWVDKDFMRVVYCSSLMGNSRSSHVLLKDEPLFSYFRGLTHKRVFRNFCKILRSKYVSRSE